jgi:radical SAM protein with 4Fe4S-binding SPASM domain
MAMTKPKPKDKPSFFGYFSFTLMNDALFSAIEIEINGGCNRRCSYCPNSIQTRQDQGEIDPRLFLRILTELQSIQFSGRVSFNFYNEPLLHSDLAGVVAKTREHLPRARIVIYTNGTRLTLARFRSLLAVGTDLFVVTRHENEKQHLFSTTYDQLLEEERSRVIYREHPSIKLTNRGGLLKHLGETGLPLTPCQIPEQVLVVTAEGKVLPCFEDATETMVMGSLNTYSLREIWHSEKYRNFRKALRTGLRHLYPACKNCNRSEVLVPTEGVAHHF